MGDKGPQSLRLHLRVEWEQNASTPVDGRLRVSQPSVVGRFDNLHSAGQAI